MNIWAFDPAGLRCEDFIYGDMEPGTIDNLGSLQIKLPIPEGSAMRSMPDRQVMFFVEAQDANVTLLRGCVTARARKGLGITVKLECICEPVPGICAAQKEIPDNSIDDDCDGLTDECDPQKDDCDDENSCTQDLCVNGKCQYSKSEDGTFCNDNDPCTEADTCQDGLCTGTTKDCSDKNGHSGCLLGTCVLGECKSLPVLNGTECDGSNMVCLDGECCSMDWITITGGTYTMGDNDHSVESPAHNVTVPSFQITKTEITQTLYQYCYDAEVCSAPNSYDQDNRPLCNWENVDNKNNPINCVDWNQAKTFCEWAGGRLPSEAEWEFATRSRGLNITYPWGDDLPSCNYAIMKESAYAHPCDNIDGTRPVCIIEEGMTEQGLCDMAGNVAEWTADWWQDGYDGAPSDGSARTGSQWDAYRAIRGGSFKDTSNYLRCTSRIEQNKDERLDSLGFRCARSQ